MQNQIYEKNKCFIDKIDYLHVLKIDSKLINFTCF